MNILKKRGLVLLLIIIFITSCAKEQCMIEKNDYSCVGFKVNDELYNDNDVILSNVEYRSDGLKINGILAKPNDNNIYPLLMFNHGDREGVEELNWIRELASKGYVVLASHYRGEGGSEGDIEIALGETTDVMNLLECGKKLDNVDKENIGVIGFSHGGGITVQAMELTSDFKAGVEFWGATDIKKRFENIAGEDDPVLNWVNVISGAVDEKGLEEKLLKRSAIYCVDKINAPLLIFHGKLDKLIPYDYALDLANELKKSGKEYEIVSYEELGHEFRRADNSKDDNAEAESMKIAVEWFDKYLK